ncbi:unnamed protein product [Cladocopium goreaui]|uniref:Uncharacterized protein n=1 Tax=Cladocopium goreaui TaxID=2562237 RepID=A0A9P1G2P0_9DINO|nr:unnamed protein product [Cladocopium goreaui]
MFCSISLATSHLFNIDSSQLSPKALRPFRCAISHIDFLRWQWQDKKEEKWSEHRSRATGSNRDWREPHIVELQKGKFLENVSLLQSLLLHAFFGAFSAPLWQWQDKKEEKWSEHRSRATGSNRDWRKPHIVELQKGIRQAMQGDQCSEVVITEFMGRTARHIRIPMIRSIALIGMLFSKSLSASAETWHICTMVERMSRDDSVALSEYFLRTERCQEVLQKQGMVGGSLKIGTAESSKLGQALRNQSAQAERHALELALLRKELEICRSEAAAQIQALREELRSMGLVKLEARNRVEQKKLRNSVFLGTSELDDGWPESVEEQGLLLLVWRHNFRNNI